MIHIQNVLDVNIWRFNYSRLFSSSLQLGEVKHCRHTYSNRPSAESSLTWTKKRLNYHGELYHFTLTIRFVKGNTISGKPETFGSLGRPFLFFFLESSAALLLTILWHDLSPRTCDVCHLRFAGRLIPQVHHLSNGGCTALDKPRTTPRHFYMCRTDCSLMLLGVETRSLACVRVHD